MILINQQCLNVKRLRFLFNLMSQTWEEFALFKTSIKPAAHLLPIIFVILQEMYLTIKMMILSDCRIPVIDGESYLIDSDAENADLPTELSSRRDIRINASPVLTRHQHFIDPAITMIVARETTYTILDGATQRCKRKLVDTQGFDYTVKRYRPTGVTNWWCSHRNDKVRCRATVNENKDSFKRGINDHCHPSVPGLQTALVNVCL